MKNERISYLDGLKALCIMLVIFAHTAYVSTDSIVGNILTTITWSAVPIFMMITGGLFHKNKDLNYKKYFNKLLKTYIVLCAWRFIYLIYGMIFNNVSYGIAQCVQYTFLFLDYSDINCAHTWYMTSYLVCMFVYPITNYLFNKNNGNNGRVVLAFMMLVCLFSGIVINDLDWWFEKLLNVLSISKLPLVGVQAMLPFNNYANMIFYFILGAFIFEAKDKISKLIKCKALLFISFAFGCFMLMLMKHIETGSFAWNGVYVSIGYNRIATIIMSVSLYLISYEYRDYLSFFNNIVGEYIGRNTLGIYYLHPIVIAIMRYILLSNTDSLSVIISVLYSILVSAICSIITVMFKRILCIIKNLVNRKYSIYK